MPDVVLSLGVNLGDRAAAIHAMTSEVRALLRGDVRFTPVMETEPVEADGEWYYNRLVEGEYLGTPLQLLEDCQTIETRLGRTRPYPRAPRYCDIDILLFGNEVIDEPTLRVPHPEIGNRRFCLEGLLYLSPKRIMPGLGITVDELWRLRAPFVQRQRIRLVTERTEIV